VLWLHDLLEGCSMPYNKDQWRTSFEGQLVMLRPHLSDRMLDTLSLSAWHSRGTKDEDPVLAAKAVSEELDAQAKKGQAGLSPSPRGEAARRRRQETRRPR